MQTFRRLNDPERYYGLSWRGWLAAAGGGGLLYAAVRLSPLATKPTISITVVVLGIIASLLYGLSGQALGPGRYLAAAVAYRLSAKQLTLSSKPDGRAFTLSDAPPAPDPSAGQLAPELEEALT
jgi:hypothetical protein